MPLCENVYRVRPFLKCTERGRVRAFICSTAIAIFMYGGYLSKRYRACVYQVVIFTVFHFSRLVLLTMEQGSKSISVFNFQN